MAPAAAGSSSSSSSSLSLQNTAGSKKERPIVVDLLKLTSVQEQSELIE
jgi:hypothetical protein